MKTNNLEENAAAKENSFVGNHNKTNARHKLFNDFVSVLGSAVDINHQ